MLFVLQKRNYAPGLYEKMRKIVRDRILKKCGYKCVQCKSTENLEVDHIIPLARGGKHNEKNMQILCRSCNRKKNRSVDLNKYFRIGVSPEYIEVHTDIWEDFICQDPKNNISIYMAWMESKFNENDDFFGVE